MGIVVLALLLTAMAMVAITGDRAAKRAETKLQAAASQTHQLLTPIAVVIGLADSMVHGELGRNQKALRYGSLLHGHGKRLHKIVDRAMRASAIEFLDTHIRLDPVDVSKVASTALGDLQPLISARGFSVERSLAEEHPTVRAGPEALRQCIGDLLSNAIKYGESGHWVKSETCDSVAGPAREVQMRVHDRGAGIPAREVPRIFEPYYRVSNAQSAAIPGAGRGLKLVRETMKRMGGKRRSRPRKAAGARS